MGQRVRKGEVTGPKAPKEYIMVFMHIDIYKRAC